MRSKLRAAGAEPERPSRGGALIPLGGAILLLLAVPAHSIRIERLTGPLAAGRSVEVVAEQALVRFAPGAARAVLASAGARVVMELPSVGWTLAALPAGMPVAQGLQLLANLPGVLAVEPNHAYRPDLTPNDPLVPSQYALAQVSAFSAWEYEVGTSCRATVAVIDTGIQAAQAELSGKLTGTSSQFCDPGADKVSSVDDLPCVSETATAACNHGTRVAGVAAAAGNNGSSIAGMSWGARLVSYRVFRTADCASDCSGAGCATDDAAIINAISHVAALQNTAAYGKIVINMSLGGAGQACGAAVKTAMDAAVTAGIPVVVAAGNDGGAVNAPGNCATSAGGTGIIPVGATDASNSIPSFSSRGPELSANGVVAPGVSVLTTDLNDNTVSASGTSFAAPHVAGLAALILSAKPAFTAPQVQSSIRGGAESIGISTLGLDPGGLPQGNSSGAGRINAFRAVRLAVNGTLADFAGDQKAIAFPNPFRLAQTPQVTFTIPLSLQGAHSKITVFTQSGELVRELTNTSWDGKNKDGKLVASGTYIFLVSTDLGKTRGRVAVIR